MLENQSHTAVTDIHCFSRLGKWNSTLARPVNNDGNRKGQPFIAALNSVDLIIHRQSIGSSDSEY
jgi:hypothetical protein